MWLPRLFRPEEDSSSSKMTNDFTLDEEVVRRLVERIIKLEVLHETLKRRVEEPFLGHELLGVEDMGENNGLMFWNRILRLEEGHQLVQKHVQELFANVMDLELQSRGEPCHLHENGSYIGATNKPKLSWKQELKKSLNKSSWIGMKYLSNSLGIKSRIFWSMVLLLCLAVCVMFVKDAYFEWMTSSVVVSYHETQTPLGYIPFPAVTVCPERNIRADLSLESLMPKCKSLNCTEEILERASAATILCPALAPLLPLDAWSENFSSSSPRFIQELFPPCTQDISAFHWPDRGSESCSKVFQTLYIDDRVCYSFNLLPASALFFDTVAASPVLTDDTGLSVRPGWNPYHLHHPDAMDKTVPLHIDDAGESYKLTVGLHRNLHQKLCPELFQTHQVALHHPSELPSRSNHRYLRLPLGHSLFVSVTPHLESSAVGWQGYHPTRTCLLQNEVNHRLLLFKHYTQTNCEIECRVKCSINLCGCVPFSLPRLNNSTKWCGQFRRYCTDTLVPDIMRGKITWEAIAKHYRKAIRDDLHQTVTDHLYNLPGQEALTERVLSQLEPDCSCECPPTCDQLSYTLDTQLVPTSDGKRSLENKSEINIYFKEGQGSFTVTERRIICNFSDFVGHCSGLVALFTGVSLLSLVELMWLGLGAQEPREPQGAEVGGASTSANGKCHRRRPEWDQTAQTDPLFITDHSLHIGQL